MTTWAIACLCPVFPALPGSLGAPADGASEQVRLQRAAQGLQPVSSLQAASVPVPVTPTLPLGCNSTGCAQLGAQLTTQLLLLVKISQLKFLPLQVHDLLSCYFLWLWLIPIFYVSCYPEKHFWTVLKSLEASSRWTMAVCFLQFLFISSKLKAGFLQF